MLEEPHTDHPVCLDHDRRVNVIQLIALSVVIGVASGVAARLTGAGWGMSILISWVATIVGVFGFTGLIFLLEELFERDDRPALPSDLDRPGGAGPSRGLQADADR